MPAMPPPIADERAGLKEYVAAQQYAFHAIAFGLTDEQARSTPSVSALSIGGLIKHVTNCQHGWMERVAAAPELTESDKRPMEDQAADYQRRVRHARRRDARLGSSRSSTSRTPRRSG